MPKYYLSPQEVHEIYAELLKGAGDIPVALQAVVDELVRRGRKNPRTGRPPTRGAVWLILKATAQGRKLLEINKNRQNRVRQVKKIDLDLDGLE